MGDFTFVPVVSACGDYPCLLMVEMLKDAGYSLGAGYRYLRYVQQDAVFKGLEAEISYVPYNANC
ncbi:MAG TPA: hypothetical protein ACHBX0_12980 [Arsenophonus sp.]